MKPVNILSTIEARMNSKRLPGKVMKKINNIPIIEHIYMRANKSKIINKIVVITSRNKSDNRLASHLKLKKIPYYRGSENNVLERLVKAGKKFKANIIVQLTGDNPLVDHNIIDYMLKFYLKNKKYSYVTNNGFGIPKNRTVPYGLDVQIFRYDDLYNNYKISKKKDLKEHPSLYFYREGKKKYKLKNLKMPKKWSTNLDLRLTVDTKQDFQLIKKLFKNLSYKKNKFFSFEDVIKHIKKNKKLLLINNKVKQRKVDFN